VFRKLLVANRGEIACRVMRAAQRMGIATVAVYSEADRYALHVSLADEAVCVGPAQAQASYLHVDRILAACKATGAQAVHPGYGFLSENADFARRVAAEGLVFIGPHWRAIAAMGDKLEARRLARDAGVSVIPGSDAPMSTLQAVLDVAERIGYPVMIKAAAGGGGKGLRIAREQSQVREGYDACRREAAGAFGDDRVFVEKYIDNPRHIEMQVLADTHGHCVTLHERECSIQRRHQKLIEESPSPFVDEGMRMRMSEQAVALARAVDYCSAGTVEFVVDARRRFYFLEMNTRLQVEHPVTEAVTGLDLVEQMIRVAAGQPLPFAQEAIRLDGWAIECRLNAEDPVRDFLPSGGRLSVFKPPETQFGVRVDAGVREGDRVPLFYDSLLAKVVAHGDSRDAALARLRDALDVFLIDGVRTNKAFLSAVLNHERFRGGDFDTQFIAQTFPEGFSSSRVAYEDVGRLAALAAVVYQRRVEANACLSDVAVPARYVPPRQWQVLADRQCFAVRLDGQDKAWRVECDDQYRAVSLVVDEVRGLLAADVDGVRIWAELAGAGSRVMLTHRGFTFDAEVLPVEVAALLPRMPEAPVADEQVLRAPMSGVVREVAVAEGDVVSAGQKLVVIEAMKMESVVRAQGEAHVRAVKVDVGSAVAADAAMIEFD